MSEDVEDDGEIPYEEDGEEETEEEEETTCYWCGTNPCTCYKFAEAA